MAERDYQTWAIEELWRYFEKHDGNPIVAMPTGTGKSHIISGFALKALRAYPATRLMVLTHVKELIVQNMTKFLDAWPTAPAGIFSAGLNKKEFHLPITFGGIASVAKKAHLFGRIDILFIDECDLVNPSEKTMYAKFIAQLKTQNPYLKVIGLTATPWRAGLGYLTNEGGLFTDVPVDMTGVDAFNWFIEEGYLVPLLPKPTKLELDVSGVHMRGGDFIEKELQIAVDKTEITHAALREAIEYGHDRRGWLVFASGVQHAKHIADELCVLGIDARAVYSGMEKDGLNRDQIIQDFKSQKLRAVVNNNILTTGFDAPHVDFEVILRPTGSSRLWVQMLGRSTRPVYVEGYDLSTKDGRLAAIGASQKHNTLVMDFAANIRKLGPINDPVIPGQRGKGGPGEAPVKVCPDCDTYNHTSVRFCGGRAVTDPQFNRDKGCGHEFIFEVKLKVQASTIDIIKGKMDLPIIESFKVDQITYNIHNKAGSPPIMKVTYYCGLQNFTDYICVEHPEGNFARKRAKEWWRARADGPVPTKTDDALDKAQNLQAPTHLQVWVNKKYPEILRYCFDGSDFGRIGAAEVNQNNIPEKTVTTQRMQTKSWVDDFIDSTKMYNSFRKDNLAKLRKDKYDDMDDDIPF